MPFLAEEALNKSTDYTLQLVGMPVGNQEIDYVVNTEFFERMESFEIRSGVVNVALNVKNSGGTIVLDFKMDGNIVIACDRCLDDLSHRVDTDYQLTIKLGEDYSEDDDVITVPKDEREIDLSPYIYDTIALTIPIRHVHPEGECNKEMEEALRRANAETVEEEKESNDPRWDALRALLDNK